MFIEVYVGSVGHAGSVGQGDLRMIVYFVNGAPLVCAGTFEGNNTMTLCNMTGAGTR